MGGMRPRRCLLGKRCLPNTPPHPVYKWVSHNAIIQESYFCLFLYLIYFILQQILPYLPASHMTALLIDTFHPDTTNKVTP
jgi:hypothetical protein